MRESAKRPKKVLTVDYSSGAFNAPVLRRHVDRGGEAPEMPAALPPLPASPHRVKRKLQVSVGDGQMQLQVHRAATRPADADA